MSKILIVDDDPHIRELAALFLRNAGFEILEADNGVEALAVVDSAKVDLFIIDIMMPQMDGWQLCQELKASFDLPVLMLTAKGDISQKVKGFQLGTDDYLVKPFEPQELVERARALLRRYKINSQQQITFGAVLMDHKTFTVNFGQDELTLPLKEFELLYKLACYPGMTFSREQLLEDIWGYDHVGTDRTLDVHINRLRERFPEESSGFKITTVRGLGYRLEVAG